MEESAVISIASSPFFEERSGVLIDEPRGRTHTHCIIICKRSTALQVIRTLNVFRRQWFGGL